MFVLLVEDRDGRIRAEVETEDDALALTPHYQLAG
jgi:hypothetical protein